MFVGGVPVRCNREGHSSSTGDHFIQSDNVNSIFLFEKQKTLQKILYWQGCNVWCQEIKVNISVYFLFTQYWPVCRETQPGIHITLCSGDPPLIHCQIKIKGRKIFFCNKYPQQLRYLVIYTYFVPSHNPRGKFWLTMIYLSVD